MGLFRFKACRKCRGDLVLEEGDWLCLQCGTYYYTGLYHLPRSSTSDAGRRIGPEPAPQSCEKGREKALASEPTMVMPDAVGLPPLSPPNGRFASGIAVTPETGTMAR